MPIARRAAVVPSVLLAVVAAAAASAPARAQITGGRVAPAPVPSARRRCASLRPIGSTLDTVYLTLDIEPGDALPVSWREMALEGVAEHFRAPASLDVPAVGSAPRPPDARSGEHVDIVSAGIGGEAIVTLRRTGALGAPRLTATTLSPALDQSLLDAIRGLDSAGALPPYPPTVKADSVRLRFGLGARGDSAWATRALFVARQPTWRLDRPALARLDNPTVDYPRDRARAGIGDEVVISFVVDSTGVPLMRTARVIRQHYREFVQSVLRVLPRFRFEPARIDGCPVPQLVQMPFVFSMERSGSIDEIHLGPTR